jgi:hypothetical protein
MGEYGEKRKTEVDGWAMGIGRGDMRQRPAGAAAIAAALPAC